MTTATYETVLEQAQQLTPEDQARLMDALEELAEQQWTASFAASQDALAQLASKALADFDAGRTEPLDPDQL